MTILTDGPMLEPADKWTAAYIQQIEAAHAHQVLVSIVIALVLIVVLVAAVIVVPRLWRRARAALGATVRMPDPVISRAAASDGAISGP
jgi:hypothetical protein